MSRLQDQLVLAIETTAPRCGAALARASGCDVHVVAEHYAADGAGRAESLASCVRAVLETSGYNARRLTGIAVVDGPGSYTGLRVGLALARGIALIDGLRLAPVGSLELMARAIAHDAPLCTVLDAGQGKVYAAGYLSDGRALCEVRAPAVVPGCELIAHVGTWRGKWVICGDSALASAVALDVVAPPGRAAELARAGIERFAEGRGLDAQLVLPRYVGSTGARPLSVPTPAAVVVG